MDIGMAEDSDALTTDQLMSACNEFQAKCWYLPNMDYSAMSEEKRTFYRITMRGVAALCQRVLAAIDAGTTVEADGDVL